MSLGKLQGSPWLPALRSLPARWKANRKLVERQSGREQGRPIDPEREAEETSQCVGGELVILWQLPQDRGWDMVTVVQTGPRAVPHKLELMSS